MLKAIDVYLDNDAIAGVQKDRYVPRDRQLSSRILMYGKAPPESSEFEPRARWIFGGHQDPDAGQYATVSPTAAMLAHTLIVIIAVNHGWPLYIADVSSAFLQGERLPESRGIYGRIPSNWPKSCWTTC